MREQTMPAMQDLMWTRLSNIGAIPCLHDDRRTDRRVVRPAGCFRARHGERRERVDMPVNRVVSRKRWPSLRPDLARLDNQGVAVLQKINRQQRSLGKRFGRYRLPS
ncbi:hypothetical protein [Rhizobium sp. SG2393]|uniref:hypothetical protein n=1 Tax=Rhizobium sp. SG2393 TaxID=3276279 RepID=UPI00366FE946